MQVRWSAANHQPNSQWYIEYLLPVSAVSHVEKFEELVRHHPFCFAAIFGLGSKDRRAFGQSLVFILLSKSLSE